MKNTQLKELFNSPEKWNAFLELAPQKEAIKNEWFETLRNEADKKFNGSEKVENWGFESWTTGNMHWYFKEYGNNSIRLLFGWWGELILYCDKKDYNIDKIKEYLQKDEFRALKDCFRIDYEFKEENEHIRLVGEIRNFIFDKHHSFNTNLNGIDRLSWFAGNETEDFLNQIVEKVNRFRKDPLINNLLRELNEGTKK